MSWNDITITDVGSRLLSDMINGGKLTITRVAIGAGTVPPDELSAQTDVSEQINAPALLAGKSSTEDGKGTILKIQIRNSDVSEAVRMRQIAVFAKTDQEDAVLLAILQDGIGEEIPAYSDFPQFEINQWITLAISKTNNIVVEISSDVFVTFDDIKELESKVEEFSSNADGFAPATHTHTADQIDGLPTELPANGGNADTVDGEHVVTTAELGLHRMSSGTAAANSANCPPGCWYGQYE